MLRRLVTAAKVDKLTVREEVLAAGSSTAKIVPKTAEPAAKRQKTAAGPYIDTGNANGTNTPRHHAALLVCVRAASG